MSAASSTFETHCYLHSKKSAISLSWVVSLSNLGSLLIVVEEIGIETPASCVVLCRFGISVGRTPATPADYNINVLVSASRMVLHVTRSSLPYLERINHGKKYELHSIRSFQTCGSLRL